MIVWGNKSSSHLELWRDIQVVDMCFLYQRRCTLQGRQGKEDTEDISGDHYLAGFRQKYYTLVGRCFQTFSFFLLPLLMRSLCRPLKMLRKLSLLSSSVSVSRVTFCTLALTHLICFTLKSWANSSPCFKISQLDWKSVESCSFKAFTTLFSFPSILWCSLIEEFNLLPSLGLS